MSNIVTIDSIPSKEVIQTLFDEVNRYYTCNKESNNLGCNEYKIVNEIIHNQQEINQYFMRTIRNLLFFIDIKIQDNIFITSSTKFIINILEYLKKYKENKDASFFINPTQILEQILNFSEIYYQLYLSNFFEIRYVISYLNNNIKKIKDQNGGKPKITINVVPSSNTTIENECIFNQVSYNINEKLLSINNDIKSITKCSIAKSRLLAENIPQQILSQFTIAFKELHKNINSIKKKNNEEFRLAPINLKEEQIQNFNTHYKKILILLKTLTLVDIKNDSYTSLEEYKTIILNKLRELYVKKPDSFKLKDIKSTDTTDDLKDLIGTQECVWKYKLQNTYLNKYEESTV